MLIHLSQLANFVVPFSGVILPIVMWATEKENSAKVDAHGRIVFNWLISSTIYFICSAILVLLGIGILMLIALGIASVIFTILGGIKANEGKIWNTRCRLGSFPLRHRKQSVEKDKTPWLMIMVRASLLIASNRGGKTLLR